MPVVVESWGLVSYVGWEGHNFEGPSNSKFGTRGHNLTSPQPSVGVMRPHQIPSTRNQPYRQRSSSGHYHQGQNPTGNNGPEYPYHCDHPAYPNAVPNQRRGFDSPSLMRLPSLNVLVTSIPSKMDLQRQVHVSEVPEGYREGEGDTNDIRYHYPIWYQYPSGYSSTICGSVSRIFRMSNLELPRSTTSPLAKTDREKSMGWFRSGILESKDGLCINARGSGFKPSWKTVFQKRHSVSTLLEDSDGISLTSRPVPLQSSPVSSR
mmetsp:Transcript_3521/g.6638  ORF Transcript_3521/g.6638 Transcript_3521/m.6638 type:complete len:264 (-) Transcript_3521:832-1623(-)